MRGLVGVAIALLLAANATAQIAPRTPDTLTLVRSVRMGRERGVAAMLARLNARVADTRIGQRRADLLPNLSAGASVTRQTLNLDEFGIPIAQGVTDPFSLFRLQVRVTQAVLDPAAWNRLKAARDSAVASGLDAVTAGTAAGATAGVAYLRALSAEETVAAREADSVVAGRLLDQAHQLLQAGLTPAIDQTRSEVNFAAVRSQLAVAHNQRDRARLDLARALDLPPATPLVLADTALVEPVGLPASPDSAVAFALGHRSELAAERERLRAMELALAAVRAENLPSAAVGGAYQETGRGTGTLKGTYTAQLGVSIPILDGFHRQLRSREQAVRIEAQEVRVKDLTDQIDAEARQALLDLASAREQVRLALERQRLAEQELAQAEQRFRAGVAGTIETSNAQAGLIAARDGVIQARVALGIARVSAYRALGVLEQMQ